METRKYLPRLIDKQLEKYLQTFGAVCVEGPKWCGKTWTSAHHSHSEIYLGDPAGNFQNRQLAELSPELVLTGASPRLIDEWQEVPPLWDAVRHEVDRGADTGRFILTGSATPNHKGILHSGAGRIGRLRMRTMSLYESGDSSGAVSLAELCAGTMRPAMTGEVSLLHIAELIVRGGWPGAIHMTAEQASLIAREYITAVLDDDVYRTDGIKRNVNKMRLLLRSLARNESTTVSNKTLLRDIKTVDNEDISMDALRDYLDILERLFIIDNQLPFATKIRSSVRVKQSPKRHLADPSLACALLGATPQSLIGDLETLGFLFEALCERDLRIYADSMGAALYHYQDYSNKEIDAIIELPTGAYCAIEIKLGANQIDTAAAGLLALQQEMLATGDKPPQTLIVLCGLSGAAYRRPDGVYVVPLTALKD